MTETTPPVYNAVSTSDNPTDDKPPSYFNVLSQIRAAKSETDNPASLAMKTISIVCGSFISTACLAISLVIPIAALIIGVLFRKECIIQPYIPTWLIVIGATGIVSALMKFITNLIQFCVKRKTGEQKEPKIFNCCMCLLSLFNLGWFIAGNVWVYSIYSKVAYDELVPDNYCNQLCYMFAFWFITATWLILALLCLCLCGTIFLAIGAAGVAACFSGKK